MELKDYQKNSIEVTKTYLQSLLKYYKRNEQIINDYGPEMSTNFPQKAWEEVVGTEYNSKKNGLNENLPNFCLKIPTGGGKTLLATHTISLINTYYMQKQTGIVLWIVPTTQIYRQTLQNLKDRNHPYRQILDIASGNRTIILEKMDKFTPQDVEENLVIMMLMLPSANRRTKETLKIFRDAGGFDLFFPPEDMITEHEKLLEKFPNLDCFGEKDAFFGNQVMTSLGNTLKILKPIIVVDESQKAYSEGAQRTIRDFNPNIMFELSATPTSRSNPLVDIKGRELDREEMIKLDINVNNSKIARWEDTLLASIEKRNYLERLAEQYQAKEGRYIRPIALIQVERTGAKQQDSGYIHAEHVKNYIINQCEVDPSEIAIKSSDKDDIEGIDLLSEECPIRYIITKQALQEGWDCSFAYILTVLTNPTSEMSITQLVGRILRQPYAQKTGITELDECYVYAFRERAIDIVEGIKRGLEGEGLGDLTGNIIQETERGKEEVIIKEYRDKFKKFMGNIYLPRFVLQTEDGWREVNYEMDILSRINWGDISLEKIKDLELSKETAQRDVVKVGLSEDEKELITTKAEREIANSDRDIEEVFLARHISDLVPNPWVAAEISVKTIDYLRERYEKNIINSNTIFIIQELRKVLENEIDRLAERVFRNIITNGELCFFLQKSKGFVLRSKMAVNKNTEKLTKENGEPLDKDLFDFVPADELNRTERAVAYYLDEQEKLLWWYRNIAKKDYYVQGWRKNKIYPDFIFSQKDEGDHEDYSKVYVLETKGLHLVNNPDSEYKKNIFDLCNKLGEQMDWETIKREFDGKKVVFKLLDESEWQRKLNEMLSE